MCTGKGYVGRELLSLCSRERGVLIQGFLRSPLKSGGFGGTFVCTGKRYVERELLSLRSRERGVLIQGSLCSPLKSGGFCGTGKGYVKRELLLFQLRERGYLFRARYARLSKVVVLVALLCAPVRGM